MFVEKKDKRRLLGVTPRRLLNWEVMCAWDAKPDASATSLKQSFVV